MGGSTPRGTYSGGPTAENSVYSDLKSEYNWTTREPNSGDEHINIKRARVLTAYTNAMWHGGMGLTPESNFFLT
jgi:hypothetical protein